MKLCPIVSCIITCARQNVALRGHQDDAHHYIENDALNPGNFIMFLKYGAYCGNIIDLQRLPCQQNLLLEDHSERYSGNLWRHDERGVN